MPDNGDLCYAESFTSFLAGFLLTKKTIGISEFNDVKNDFENLYNIWVSGDSEINKINIYIEPHCIYILENLDDIILVNGKKKTTFEYLYSLTSPRVRDYFKLYNLNKNIKNENGLVKKLLKHFII